eukprot:1498050-Amphidinium_carterae.1
MQRSQSFLVGLCFACRRRSDVVNISNQNRGMWVCTNLWSKLERMLESHVPAQRRWGQALRNSMLHVHAKPQP